MIARRGRGLASGTRGGLSQRGARSARSTGASTTWVNLLGVPASRLFLVSRLFKYIGVRGALFVLPLVAARQLRADRHPADASPSSAWPRSLENSTDYSIQNTARQALFLPTSREAKYKAKQAIDSFFWRAGDLLQAVVVFVGARWPSTSAAVRPDQPRASSRSGSWLVRRHRARASQADADDDVAREGGVMRTTPAHLLRDRSQSLCAAGGHRGRAGAGDPRRGAPRASARRRRRSSTPPKPAGLERAAARSRERTPVRAAPQPRRRLLSQDRQHHRRAAASAFGPGLPPAGPVRRTCRLRAFAAASLQRVLDARGAADAAAPGRAGGCSLDAHVQRYEFPRGARSSASARTRGARTQVNFGLRDTVVGGIRRLPRRRRGSRSRGGVDYLHAACRRLRPRRRDPQPVHRRHGAGPARAARFHPLRGRRRRQLPAAARQPARAAGAIALTYQRFDDLDSGPLLASTASRPTSSSTSRCCAIAASWRCAPWRRSPTPWPAPAVPFYFQRTLGGPDDLRGFRRFRFRDEQRAAAAGGVSLGDLHRDGRRHLLRRRQGRVAHRGPELATTSSPTTASASASAPRTASSCASRAPSAAAAASTSSCGSAMSSNLPARAPRGRLASRRAVACAAPSSRRRASAALGGAGRFFPDDPLQVDDDKAFDASGATPIEGSNGYDFAEHTFLKPGDRRDMPAVNVNTVGRGARTRPGSPTASAAAR